jgi:hypothetical protein
MRQAPDKHPTIRDEIAGTGDDVQRAAQALDDSPYW